MELSPGEQELLSVVGTQKLLDLLFSISIYISISTFFSKIKLFLLDASVVQRTSLYYTSTKPHLKEKSPERSILWTNAVRCIIKVSVVMVV